MAYVRSVNLGSAREIEGGKGVPTGIWKLPVESLTVRDPGPKHGGLGSGAVGDFIGDRQSHGGRDQALYAVAREELEWWGSELGRELPHGGFGENLTTSGLDVDDALLGELWQVGDVVLEVTGPRVPCSTFKAKMGEVGWVKRFVQHGRPGAYLAVVEGGTIRPGDPIEVVQRPAHDVTVAMSLLPYFGDRRMAAYILDVGAGSDLLRAELTDTLT